MQALSALPALPQLSMVPIEPPQPLPTVAPIPTAPKLVLPEFLNIPAADAAKLTLNPNDAHRLGAFPYFYENVDGMFVRVKVDKTSEKHIWARVICGVTADQIAEKGLIGAIGGSDAGNLMYSAPTAAEEADMVRENPQLLANPLTKAWLDLPGMWRRRLLDDPIYEWREKRFDSYFICSHPFAAGVNNAIAPAAASTPSSEDEAEAEAETEAVAEEGEKNGEEGADGEDNNNATAATADAAESKKKKKAKAPKASTPANALFIVSLRQLAKEATPTQEEVDAYCTQFKPIDVASTASAADASVSSTIISPFAAAEQTDALAYVPQGFKDSFLRLPAQTEKEAELERLEARIQDRIGKTKSARSKDPKNFVLIPPSESAPPLPHIAPAATAANKWQAYFKANVVQRALTKDDASKVVAANTRLNNVAGNAVIRSAVLYNLNLSRASQIEAARRSAEMAMSQSLKLANKAVSRQALSATNINSSQDDQFPAPTPLFPQATQLGSASQNELDGASSSQDLVPPSTPHLVFAAGAAGHSSASMSVGGTGSSLDIESLLQAALGPAATPSQLHELRSSLLAGASVSGLQQQQAPRASSTSSSGSTAVGGGVPNLMVLLTPDELRAFEKDDQMFNAYVANSDRRKEMDVLASVTTRNTKINVALRLQGHALMAIRDQEKEAEDDTMQPMWHTDDARRRQEADEYTKLKDSKAEKDDAKVKSTAPKVLSEAEELELYAAEAKRVNETILARQGSTATSSSSSSLPRAASVAEAVTTGVLGSGEDLDDLLALSAKVKPTVSSSALVRDSSILSRQELANVSKSLNRVPIVAAGSKRGRE